MDRLKGENEALIKRLRELEDSGHRTGAAEGNDLVPRQSWEVVNKEKTELEEVVRQKEKRLLRLQQVRVSFVPISLPLIYRRNPTFRYSQPKVPNSARPLRQFWDSNLPSIQTAKCV